MSALVFGLAIGRPVANAVLALAVLGTMLLAVVGRRLAWARTARRRAGARPSERDLPADPAEAGGTSQRWARR